MTGFYQIEKMIVIMSLIHCLHDDLLLHAYLMFANKAGAYPGGGQLRLGWKVLPWSSISFLVTLANYGRRKFCKTDTSGVSLG